MARNRTSSAEPYRAALNPWPTKDSGAAPEEATPSLIAIENVAKTFKTMAGDTVKALDDVSLEIKANQFITIVGPSGCGKSTLLKIIAGITAPSSGRIVFAGKPVAEPSSEIGMIFQAPVLMPWRTVLGNILFPVEMLRLPMREYRARARQLIEQVGLAGFEKSYPRELSGGMQQRVSICRALIYDPPLLLMDEPFGALDAMTREDLGMELLRIWHDRRKTVIFVTHSIPEAVMLADRVVVMTARPGRIVADFPIELPRPRTVEMEFTPEFNARAAAIREKIFQQPRARK